MHAPGTGETKDVPQDVLREGRQLVKGAVGAGVRGNLSHDLTIRSNPDWEQVSVGM